MAGIRCIAALRVTRRHEVIGEYAPCLGVVRFQLDGLTQCGDCLIASAGRRQQECVLEVRCRPAALRPDERIEYLECGQRVARAAMRVLVEEGMVENAARMGDYFMERLRGVRNNLIREVRGRGLMIAVEFEPEAKGARQYCEALKGRGILCKETHTNTIRFAPPLTTTAEELDWVLERVNPVLAEL